MRYFCISFSHNFLPRGLALYASLKRHCKEFRLNILCLDDKCQESIDQLSLPECRTIPVRDLEAADAGLLNTKASRNIAEYSFTLKPCLLRYVLQDLPEGELLTYLDADLYFFADPEPIFDELQKGSVGIIPHRFPPEFDYMKMYGIYNAGWVSFRKDSSGRACIEWWRDRCLEWCYDRTEGGGRSGDQAYLDDWPARFEGTVVIQHLGANLGPYNVGQYEIAHGSYGVTINGQKLIFYHFHALRRVVGNLFDSQLSKYGVKLTEILRQHVYKPYLGELYVLDGNPVASGPAGPISGYELIPRSSESHPGISDEQAKVEEYLYQILTLAERDRCLRLASILELQKICDDRLATIVKLENRDFLADVKFWGGRFGSKIKSRFK